MRADPIEIAVLRQGDTNRFEVTRRAGVVPPSATRVEDAFLRDVAAELAALDGSDVVALADRLDRLGSVLFRQLLPAAVRTLLGATLGASVRLRLDAALRDVPWELCRHEAGFLATTHRLGRVPLAAPARPVTPHGRTRTETLRILVLADLDGEDARLAAEAERLCLLLDGVPGVETTLIGGPGMGRVPLLAALQDHDVVHLLSRTHADPATPEASGWRLADGVLSARDLARLPSLPALVCVEEAGPGGEPTPSGPGRRPLVLADGLQRSGLPAVLGTLLAGTPRGASGGGHAEMACACDAALVAGADLGEALRRARAAVGPGAPLGHTLFLFGDPAWTARRSGDAAAAGATARAADASVTAAAPARTRRAPLDRPAPPEVIGRQDELVQLRECHARARAGERQVVLVHGPAGIGKTALLDVFLSELGADAWIGWGQAVERYGAGEAYLPVLQALSAICRQPGGGTLASHLRQQAPTWLVELPALVHDAERAGLARRAHGASRERMLRELAELVALATNERPLVLVLEDLHWADVSTLDLVSYLALRREPARLLLVGTHRPLDTVEPEHPLRRVAHELRARRLCTDVALAPLGPAHTAAYLGHRLAGGRVSDELTRAVHRRTDGHPLFLVNVVDQALREGLLVESEGAWSLAGGPAALDATVPEGLRQMIERQVDALAPADRQLLEAASAVGVALGATALAAALDADLDAVEERLEGPAGRFVDALDVEEWPDGTMAGRYRFRHALYQNVLYARLSGARRVRLHRRIGARLEQASAGRTSSMAAELAAHFEAGRDATRAIRHRREAARVALGRHAEREAIGHLRRALELVPALPEAAERAPTEVALLVELATPLMAVEGYAAREVEHVFERAHALSRQMAEGPHLYPLLRGLASFHQVRGESTSARPVGERLLALAEAGADPVALVQAHYGHGVTLHTLGEVAAAKTHLQQALALYDPGTHHTHVSVYGGYDPGVACRAWLAWIRDAEGFPEEAQALGAAALALAEELGHPLTLSFAHSARIRAALSLGDLAGAAAASERAVAVARDHGLAFQLAVAQVTDAWTAVRQGDTAGGVERMRSGIDAVLATSGRAMLPSCLNQLALALALARRFDEAWAAIDEAASAAEAMHAPLALLDIHQTRGNLHLRAPAPPAAGAEAAEACYRAGLVIARARELRAPELRLAVRLARLLRERGAVAEARRELEPVYAWFRDRSETREVRRARRELEALGGGDAP